MVNCSECYRTIGILGGVLLVITWAGFGLGELAFAKTAILMLGTLVGCVAIGLGIALGTNDHES